MIWTTGQQLLDGVRGAALLPEAEQAADQDDRQDDRRVGAVCPAAADRPAAETRMRMIGDLELGEKQDQAAVPPRWCRPAKA